MPSSKKARRYHGRPRPALRATAAAIGLARQIVCRLRIAPRSHDRQELVEDAPAGTSRPRRFRPALLRQFVHAVVPVAAAHQRQAVRPKRKLGRSLSRQCSYSDADSRRTGAVRSVRARAAPAAANCERTARFRPRSPTSPVICDVMAADQGQPEIVVGKTGSRAAAPGGCHQCCTSPSSNCRAGGPQICSPRKSGPAVDQGHHVLQLIAKSDTRRRIGKTPCAPRHGSSAFDRAAMIDQQIEARFGRVNLHGTRFRPIAARWLAMAASTSSGVSYCASSVSAAAASSPRPEQKDDLFFSPAASTTCVCIAPHGSQPRPGRCRESR